MTQEEPALRPTMDEAVDRLAAANMRLSDRAMAKPLRRKWRKRFPYLFREQESLYACPWTMIELRLADTPSPIGARINYGEAAFTHAVGRRPQNLFGICLSFFWPSSWQPLLLSVLVWALDMLMSLFSSNRVRHPPPDSQEPAARTSRPPART